MSTVWLTTVDTDYTNFVLSRALHDKKHWHSTHEF